MTDLRIDPFAAIAELAKRGHDRVRARLPELPTGLRRRLHDFVDHLNEDGSQRFCRIL
jgi:hypothetical protein